MDTVGLHKFAHDGLDEAAACIASARRLLGQRDYLAVEALVDAARAALGEENESFAELASMERRGLVEHAVEDSKSTTVVLAEDAGGERR